MVNNPLRVYCKKCGASVGFDIINQTYACKYCGEKAESSAIEKKWTELSKIKQNPNSNMVEEHFCPSCGAHIVFGSTEASVTCDFCEGTLVRKDFAEGGRLPSVILPFFITEKEAKERLLNWANKNKNKTEGKFILQNINKLKAYYLPYEFIRGPVYGDVKRDNTERKYKCLGYLEGTAINTSKQFNNLILNAAEPFDWSKALSFDYGFIAGQNVKLADISTEDIKNRIVEEAASDFLPQVEKVMQTTGVTLKVETGDVVSMPILVPMFFICEGNKTAVVNGQTGKVAASVMREKKTFPWIIEPLLYTVLATFFLNLPFGFDPSWLVLSAIVFALLFFAAMTDGRNSLIRKVILRGKNSKVEREGKKLHIKEGKEVLKNPYDNTPVFIEKNEQGEDVPVKIKFYSFGRMFGVFIRMIVMMLLPTIAAGIIRLIMIWNTDEPFMKYFQIKYGAAWYVLFGFICIIYWILGVRRDVYERPIIYETMKNGKKRLLGKRASRRIGLLSMIGVGKVDNDGSVVTIFGLLRELGGVGIFLVCFIVFMFIGCVYTILF